MYALSQLRRVAGGLGVSDFRRAALAFTGRCAYFGRDDETEAERLCQELIRARIRCIGVDLEWTTTFKKGHTTDTALLQLAWEADRDGVPVPCELVNSLGVERVERGLTKRKAFASASSSSLVGRVKAEACVSGEEQEGNDHQTPSGGSGEASSATCRTLRSAQFESLVRTGAGGKKPFIKACWPKKYLEKHPVLTKFVCVALFHFTHLRRPPPALVRLLEDPDVQKVGSNSPVHIIVNHKVRESVIDKPEEGDESWVVIETLGRKRIEDTARTGYGLGSLCEKIFGEAISKDKARISDWEAAELSKTQIKYAATDAAAHLVCYRALMEMEELSPEIYAQQLLQRSTRRKGADSTAQGQDAENTSSSSSSSSKGPPTKSKGRKSVLEGFDFRRADDPFDGPRVSLTQLAEWHDQLRQPVPVGTGTGKERGTSSSSGINAVTLPGDRIATHLPEQIRTPMEQRFANTTALPDASAAPATEVAKSLLGSAVSIKCTLGGGPKSTLARADAEALSTGGQQDHECCTDEEMLTQEDECSRQSHQSSTGGGENSAEEPIQTLEVRSVSVDGDFFLVPERPERPALKEQSDGRPHTTPTSTTEPKNSASSSSVALPAGLDKPRSDADVVSDSTRPKPQPNDVAQPTTSPNTGGRPRLSSANMLDLVVDPAINPVVQRWREKLLELAEPKGAHWKERQKKSLQKCPPKDPARLQMQTDFFVDLLEKGVIDGEKFRSRLDKVYTNWKRADAEAVTQTRKEHGADKLWKKIQSRRDLEAFDCITATAHVLSWREGTEVIPPGEEGSRMLVYLCHRIEKRESDVRYRAGESEREAKYAARRHLKRVEKDEVEHGPVVMGAPAGAAEQEDESSPPARGPKEVEKGGEHFFEVNEKALEGAESKDGESTTCSVSSRKLSVSSGMVAGVPASLEEEEDDIVLTETEREQLVQCMTSQIELTPSMMRAWWRVLQQGYTIREAAAEFGIKESTAESYVLQCIIKGRSYVWGPHLGITDEMLNRLVGALEDCPSHFYSASLEEVRHRAELSYHETRLGLMHLKALMQLGVEPREICRRHQLKADFNQWAIKRARVISHHGAGIGRSIQKAKQGGGTSSMPRGSMRTN